MNAIYSLGLRSVRLTAGKMAAPAAGVGRLEEEALRRKERLKALREKTGRKVRSAAGDGRDARGVAAGASVRNRDEAAGNSRGRPLPGVRMRTGRSMRRSGGRAGVGAPRTFLLAVPRAGLRGQRRPQSLAGVGSRLDAQKLLLPRPPAGHPLGTQVHPMSSGPASGRPAGTVGDETPEGEAHV